TPLEEASPGDRPRSLASSFFVLSGERQAHREDAVDALDRDRPAEQADDFAAQRQPQPAVHAVAGARFIATPEAIEHLRQLLARERRATVADLDGRLPVGAGCGDVDAPTGVG